MMSHSVSSVLASVALTMLVAACAGPTTQAGSASTASAGPPARSGLSGTWHGYFVHSGADYTSPSSANLMLEVRPDATYTFKWGSRPPSTGTVAAQGNRVVLGDSSGSRITLVSVRRHPLRSDEGHGHRKVGHDEPGEAGVGGRSCRGDQCAALRRRRRGLRTGHLSARLRLGGSRAAV